MEKKPFLKKTTAETVSVAFDYQYYFFLWKLLSLGTGESVGLEVKDDVHTELDDDEQIFYQVKHTVMKKKDGDAISLKTSDIDLWKTLSNWVQVITDKNDNREREFEQLSFLKKTSFVLASNKSSAGNNRILANILGLQESSKTPIEVRKVFQDLYGSSTDKNLKNCIGKVLELSDKILKEFLLKVTFELDEKDIIGKCKDAIKADKIDVNKIDHVFASLDSAIKADNFIKIRNGEKLQITFDEFYMKYRRYYDLSRNGSLSVKPFEGVLPEMLESQTFIKQLIEIKELDNSDLETIAKFTFFKLKLRNNIDRWLQEGEITPDEICSFNSDAVEQWNNKHRSIFRSITDELDYNEAGLRVLDSIRDKKLIIDGQTLDTDMSNGVFYDLSDIPVIGWRKDWKKYKK